MQQKKGDKYFLCLLQIHNYLISLPAKPERSKKSLSKSKNLQGKEL